MSCNQWPPKANAKSPFAAQYELAVKRQLREFGEWCSHVIFDDQQNQTSQQWVWLHLVSPKLDANIGGIGPDVSERDFVVRGWFPDFNPAPEKWRQNSRNHLANGKGSKIIARGLTFEVVDIDKNLWGEVRLDLIKADCQGDGNADPQFFLDLQAWIDAQCNPVLP